LKKILSFSFFSLFQAKKSDQFRLSLLLLLFILLQRVKNRDKILFPRKTTTFSSLVCFFSSSTPQITQIIKRKRTKTPKERERERARSRCVEKEEELCLWP
jgi:hypothetical protein